MRSERGQASVEWIAVLLLVSVVFFAALAVAPVVDGRPLGAALARALVCAVKRDCHSEGAALRRAYGARDAALVRANAPNLVYEPGTFTLPIDYRRCRSHRCADAPDDRSLDVSHATRGGAQATVFTHVVHRGGRTYIQYWFYYPDSPSTFFHSRGIAETIKHHPILRALPVGPLASVGLNVLTFASDKAFHPDDWEGYQVRIDADGTTSVRATRHGGYTSCKGTPEPLPNPSCKGWGTPNGWTRVSRGSHAGHIPDSTPGTGLHERSTLASGIHLVPLETLDHHSYRPQKHGIKPPWTKRVYVHPASGSS
jgi:hypothetical protein